MSSAHSLGVAGPNRNELVEPLVDAAQPLVKPCDRLVENIKACSHSSLKLRNTGLTARGRWRDRLVAHSLPRCCPFGGYADTPL
jgi:hypothetical protein